MSWGIIIEMKFLNWYIFSCIVWYEFMIYFDVGMGINISFDVKVRERRVVVVCVFVWYCWCYWEYGEFCCLVFEGLWWGVGESF